MYFWYIFRNDEHKGSLRIAKDVAELYKLYQMYQETHTTIYIFLSSIPRG